MKQLCCLHGAISVSAKNASVVTPRYFDKRAAYTTEVSRSSDGKRSVQVKVRHFTNTNLLK
jgi:hypothetical protein